MKIMLLSSIFLISVTCASSITATISPALKGDEAQAGWRLQKNSVGHVKKSGFKIYNAAHFLKSDVSQNVYHIKENKTSIMNFVKHINTFKRKGNKKYPKRTIQKIIKKSRKNKINKMLLLTSTQTQPSLSFQKEDFTTTTQAQTLHKKTKKWNSKLTRYPLPFHKLNARKDINIHHKIKREVKDVRDVFVLQDLDEIEFLSNEDGTKAIKAHIKRPW